MLCITQRSLARRIISHYRTLTVNQVVSADPGDKKLTLQWSNNEVTSFPYVYLLDNEPYATGRRLLTARETKSVLQPEEVRLSHNESVTITWPGGKQSVYPMTWLAERRNGTRVNEHQTKKREYWDAESLLERPKFDFRRLQEDKQYLLNMLLQLQSHGFAILKNGGNGPDTGPEIAKLLNGAIRPTYYSGGSGVHVVEVINSGSKNSVAYLPKHFCLHCDIATYHYPIEVAILHCSQQMAGEGGETWLCDSFHAAEQIREEHPVHFRLLSTVPIYWRDVGGEPGAFKYSVENWYPIISVDFDVQIEMVRISDHMRGSHFANEHKDKLLSWYEAYFNFYNLIHSEQYCAKYKMQNGDMLILDNKRVLHGRGGVVPLPNDFRLLYVYYCSWRDVVTQTKVLQQHFNAL